MSRLKVAVVGAGAWGRNHVRTLAGMADVELVAVCDLDARRRLGGGYRVRARIPLDPP